MTAKKPSTGCCRGCGRRLAWIEQRRQFGRLFLKGWPPERIKAVLPRCQKCTTRYLWEQDGDAQPEQAPDDVGTQARIDWKEVGYPPPGGIGSLRPTLWPSQFPSGIRADALQAP